MTNKPEKTKAAAEAPQLVIDEPKEPREETPNAESPAPPDATPDGEAPPTEAAEASAASGPADVDPVAMGRLHDRLRSLNEDLFAVKSRKADADAKFNAEIKSIKADMKKVLGEMHDLEWPIQLEKPTLPFDKPPEPLVETCQACGGTGRIVDDQCTECGGLGKVIPQQEEKAPAEPAPEPPSGKCACGHIKPAHFDEEGNERACIIKGCGCSKEGGYDPSDYAGPWLSKFTLTEPPEGEAANET